MLGIEPPRTNYDLHFKLAGVPVRVHPLFWLASLLLGAYERQPVLVLIWVGALFVSILVHEFGHAVAIRYFGWKPRIILYHFGGLAAYDPSESYGFEYHGDDSNPRAKILIALAGPLAGFLLAALIVGVLFAIGRPAYPRLGGEVGLTWDISEISNLRLQVLLGDLLFINILWGLVNLLPVYPLDGGQVAREVLEIFEPHQGTIKSLWLSVFTGGAMAIFSLLWFSEFRNRLFMAVLFGVLAYSSYMTLNALRGGGGFGGGGFGGGGYGGGGYGDGGYGGYRDDRDW